MNVEWFSKTKYCMLLSSSWISEECICMLAYKCIQCTYMYTHLYPQTYITNLLNVPDRTASRARHAVLSGTCNRFVTHSHTALDARKKRNTRTYSGEVRPDIFLFSG